MFKPTHVLGNDGKYSQTCALASSDKNYATFSKSDEGITCLTCADGSTPVQRKCTITSSSTCSKYAPNYTKCDLADNECFECQYSYGLRGGQCSKCDASKFISVKDPCKADCIV